MLQLGLDKVKGALEAAQSQVTGQATLLANVVALDVWCALDVSSTIGTLNRTGQVRFLARHVLSATHVVEYLVRYQTVLMRAMLQYIPLRRTNLPISVSGRGTATSQKRLESVNETENVPAAFCVPDRLASLHSPSDAAMKISSG